jgi:subtilisin family serine protease
MELLRLSDFSAATGRGVRVAVIDSGVHAAHPHVQGVYGGVGIEADGREHADYIDRIGHGTAVTAVIREKAPDAEIFCIKVFDRELATTAIALVAAIDCAVRHQARLINLSLGTSNQEHELALTSVVARADAAGARVMAAAPQGEVRWLPGAIAGVIAVELDWTISRDECRVERGERGRIVRVYAAGYPRPIPGVPPERNLRGASFAVANGTGLLARALELTSGTTPSS